MGVINCSDCGIVILKKYIDLCSDCIKHQREDLMKIKEYLVVHQSANVIEVMHSTGLTLNRIRELTKEHSLTR